MLNKKVIAYLFLFVATLSWGASFFMVKQATLEIGVWPFLTTRFVIASLILGIPLTGRLLKSPHQSIKDGAILGILLFGAIGTQTLGLQTNSSGRSGFITALYVPFTPILAWILLKQKIRLRQVGVVYLALTGLVIMTLGEDVFHFQWRAGDMWTLATAIISAAHIVLTERYTRRNKDSLLLGVWQIIWATLWMVIFSIIDRQTQIVNHVNENWAFQTWSFQSWFDILFAAAIVTCFAFTVQIFAQKYVSTLKAAVIFALEAPFASLFAFIFVGEWLTAREWVGAALVFISCIIPEEKKHGSL